MRYILENETLKVEVESFGAELKSVYSKAEDKEYMWYADSKYWGRTSPVLFPLVPILHSYAHLTERMIRQATAFALTA